MKAMPLFLSGEWAAKVANHELIYCDDLQAEALRNMLIFPLSDLQSACLESGCLSEFLMQLFREFCRKAARLQVSGWFYAWFDEMSGTLRCSTCNVRTPDMLPFSCALRIVDVPHDVAHAAANSPYISGIPVAEFQNVETESDEGDDSTFELTVFARRLIASTQ